MKKILLLMKISHNFLQKKVKKHDHFLNNSIKKIMKISFKKEFKIGIKKRYKITNMMIVKSIIL